MSRRNTRLVLGSLIALLLIGLLIFKPGLKPDHAPTPVTTASTQTDTNKDFTLFSLNGPTSLSSFKGKYVLLYFGYTFCPDICPTSLSNVASALKQLTPEQNANIQLLFISVDPERDTPSRLQEYVTFFNPSFIGLTADQTSITDVTAQYNVIYAKQPAKSGSEAYSIDHSAMLYVLDRNGKQIDQIGHDANPDQIAATLSKYLNSPKDKP